MNLTRQYPFKTMQIGQYFTVSSRFQHARVAASEYGRKHNQCFTCRMQEDRTMRIYRIEVSQQEIDARGAMSRREIPATNDRPTEMQWVNWLNTLQPGQSHAMPLSYQSQYLDMMQWTARYSSGTGAFISAGLWHDGTLMVHRIV